MSLASNESSPLVMSTSTYGWLASLQLLMLQSGSLGMCSIILCACGSVKSNHGRTWQMLIEAVFGIAYTAETLTSSFETAHLTCGCSCCQDPFASKMKINILHVHLFCH